MILGYIDPGTGSMLFTILLGVIGASIYTLSSLFLKIRFVLSAGKLGKADRERISLLIFSDSKRYWNVFCPICEELDRRGQKTVYMTSSPDDPALKHEFKHVECRFIGEGNRAYAKLNCVNADLFLATTPGLDVYQWKRSKGVKFYVHIQHAASDPISYRMFGLDYYDSVLISGEYQADQIREMEELRHLPAKELPLVGIPYMDEMKKRLETSEPLPPHPKTILLAPSWGKSAIFSRYGAKIFEALKRTGYHVIVRPHPQSYSSESKLLEDLKASYPDSDWLEWNHDNDNFEVLRRSDLLISDFSGVIFDFALVFDKPIIYADTSYDPAPYDAFWMKGQLWCFKVLPKMGPQLSEENLSGLKQMIDQCLKNPKYGVARDQARAETWAHRGEGTRLVVDYLIKKLAELKSGK